jgi:hypothetical protein
MCLNITGQCESDVEKLNMISLDILVSENTGWYHVAIALETRDLKNPELRGKKRPCVELLKHKLM